MQQQQQHLLSSKMLFVVAMFMLFGIGLTGAQVPFPGRCPDVKVMDEFDLDAYMGIWYEYSKYPFIFEIGKRCMYARYVNEGNFSVSVMNAAINRLTGNPSNITGTATVIGPARLAVVFNSHQSADKANYLVLGTDYTSWAVVYSCSNFTSVAHTKIVWILTRERVPSDEAVNAAKQVLKDNQLSERFLIQTIQENCPVINATMTENDNFGVPVGNANDLQNLEEDNQPIPFNIISRA